MPLVSPEFFHNAPRPKEIRSSPIYYVIRAKQLNKYLCPTTTNNTQKLKEKILFFISFLKNYNSFPMGCVCLVDTAQLLKPCDPTGHCHLQFLSHTDFHGHSLFITANTETGLYNDMASSKGMQSDLFTCFTWSHILLCFPQIFKITS